MQVKIKKLDINAVIPVYAKDGDAGLDLVAVSVTSDKNGNIVYGTGLAIEIPEGYEGQIRPRSSIRNYDLRLVNSPGTIDSNYRGEILCVFDTNYDDRDCKMYKIGDRIAQLLIKPSPYIKLVEVNELSETERGANGFGSTGL